MRPRTKNLRSLLFRIPLLPSDMKIAIVVHRACLFFPGSVYNSLSSQASLSLSRPSPPPPRFSSFNPEFWENSPLFFPSWLVTRFLDKEQLERISLLFSCIRSCRFLFPFLFFSAEKEAFWLSVRGVPSTKPTLSFSFCYSDELSSLIPPSGNSGCAPVCISAWRVKAIHEFSFFS